MDHIGWLKQQSEPLFPDILWSRPESKRGAGKLLIIGGNQFGFGAPGQAFAEAEAAGIGVVNVLLPDAIRKIAGGMLPDAEFAPSTPSGSFSKKALDDFIRLSNWADGVLLAGDLGRNSETSILLETFVKKYDGLLTITQDAAEYFRETPKDVINRENTVLVLSLSQLQKVFINTPHISPITLGMGTVQLVEALQSYTSSREAIIITKHNGYKFVASKGKVSTTKDDEQLWRVKTAARSSVFWLQNPQKPFEAITTSLLAD